VLHRCRARGALGFTLVELMIVVVVLGILAGLGTVGFKRYLGRARTSEAVAMLAEMVSKEQVYFLEFGSYLPLDNKTSSPTAAVASGATGVETAALFYPRDPANAAFESTRTAQALATLPLSWQYLGVRPKDRVLYCTYFAGAGNAGSLAPSTAPALGSTVMGTAAAITQPWYYVLAACNLNGAAGYSSAVSIFALTSITPTLQMLNEGL
jgi:prepilin-type N-terminal cleavage/methylation domain-containing protein